MNYVIKILNAINARENSKFYKIILTECIAKLKSALEKQKKIDLL